MTAISFLPFSCNIKWDGQTYAKASIELPCHDTAATYSASAFPVYSASGSITVGPNTTNTYTFKFRRGDRRYASVSYDGTVHSSVLEPSVSLPVTVESNVATLVFSNITSTAFAAHAWNLTAVKNTVTRVLLRGRIDIENNPYSAGGASSVNVASDVTAFGCF